MDQGSNHRRAINSRVARHRQLCPVLGRVAACYAVGDVISVSGLSFAHYHRVDRVATRCSAGDTPYPQWTLLQLDGYYLFSANWSRLQLSLLKICRQSSASHV